jgi:hypothetical protein
MYKTGRTDITSPIFFRKKTTFRNSQNERKKKQLLYPVKRFREKRRHLEIHEIHEARFQDKCTLKRYNNHC